MPDKERTPRNDFKGCPGTLFIDPEAELRGHDPEKTTVVYHTAENAIVGTENICRYICPKGHPGATWRRLRDELVELGIVYFSEVGYRPMYHAFPTSLRDFCRYKALRKEIV